jgi:hypothetical protein
MALNVTAILQIFEVVLILLLSTIIVMIVPKIREVTNNTVKTFLYIFLGFILFTLVGMGYNVIQDMHMADVIASQISEPKSISIIYPYVQFFPLLVLAIALSGVVLVTYMDGEKYGFIFAGAAFAAMAPDIFKYASSGRFDLFLLGCVLWAIIPIIWVALFRGLVFEETTMKERVWAAISASLISYVIYMSTALIGIFGESPRDYSASIIPSILSSSGDVLKFVVMSLWFYLLLNVIIVSLLFIIHDLALHTFNMQRVVKNKKEIGYVRIHPIEDIVKEIQPKVDAYKGLVEEMQVFYQYFDKVDRLRAASTIARFKQEYNTLAARYSDGSKAEAERLIKMVDQEFKKRY